MSPKKRSREKDDNIEVAIQAPAPKLNTQAQGFKQWRTTTKLASGGKLAEMSTYDSNVSKFSHTVKIQHTDAFTLRPLTVTGGPLAGRHVLVLDPISVFFRFMDLPPEIRQIIYDILLREDHISITSRKPRGMLRRASRKAIEVYRDAAPPDMPKVGLQTTNILDTLLRISKQVASEAATTFYGNNHFLFDNLANMDIFLTGIGSMRKHLRYLRVAPNGYTVSKARPTFSLLKDATSLRTLAFDHNMICPRRQDIVADFRTLFKHLYRIQQRQEENGVEDRLDVLKIIKMEWSSKKCNYCNAPPENGWRCMRFRDCEFDCDNGSPHCEEVLEEVREMVAKNIGMAK